jgi:uncharacterized protein YndB with AHSA1/START domain
MSSITDQIRIRTTADKAFAALTTEAGYRAWWNARAEVPPQVGGAAHLHFVKDGQPIEMTFRIDSQTLNDSVKWKCVAHAMQDWIGTSLEWKIAPAGNEVVVSLDHAGWTAAGPDAVAQGWKHFLGSMKAYLEDGQGQPW